MEALAEILTAIAAFLIEVTFHAVVFIFLLLMAIFSPRYRKKLKGQWNTSNSQRFGIVLGVVMYSTALVIALLFWTPFLGLSSDQVAKSDLKQATKIELPADEVNGIKKAKEIDQLVDVAGSIIKRKLAERKQEAEQGSDGQPATHPESK
jgi:hypothetical protein